MAISVISIDLDDTLWDCTPVILNAEKAVRDWLEQHYPKITQAYSIEQMRAHRLNLIQQQPHLRHNLSELRRVSLEMIAQEFDYPTALARSAIELFLEARNQVILFDDVIPVLEKLAQDFSVVSLTNGNANLDKIGLGYLFDHFISAAEIGASKPHPAMFNAIAKVSGAAIEDIVHVGDDPVHDIQGAQTVGMRCVWINRNLSEWPTGVKPADAEISTLHELIPLLERWTN
jgi:FMN hydrolase / 5-amino-6-(5-phospho-D-ribitylamino)uracil phosphatase